MAARGEITPMPDAAIFADTGWEPKAVHQYLEWLETELPFPVYRVMHKDGLKAALLNNGRFASVPFFTSNGGMGKRQCTFEYKISPIIKMVRKLLGFAPRKRIPKNAAVMWIGISLDEAIRMKPSREQFITNRWPLIERRMTRYDCLEWMSKNNYPQPPKSSCLGCPYHSDRQWLEIKNGSPDEWRETVDIDNIIRQMVKKMHSEQFMHRSLVPLDKVNFSHIEDQADLFGNECEGMCGV